MTKKIGWLVVPVSLLMIAAGAAILYTEHNKMSEMVKLELRPLQKAGGWGYEILADDKIFIHQDCIPAIKSQKPFVSKDEAMLVGNAVISKLQRGKLAGITVDELNQLHVHY